MSHLVLISTQMKLKNVLVTQSWKIIVYLGGHKTREFPKWRKPGKTGPSLANVFLPLGEAGPPMEGGVRTR